MALFYIALILLIVMVLLNLITAVIVENAFAIVQEDEEAALKEKEKQARAQSGVEGAWFLWLCHLFTFGSSAWVANEPCI